MDGIFDENSEGDKLKTIEGEAVEGFGEGSVVVKAIPNFSSMVSSD